MKEQTPNSTSRRAAAVDFRILFDRLSDEQQIGIGEFAQLLETSGRALYMRRYKGLVPEPLDLGVKLLRWRVGDVRAWMKGLGHAQAPAKVERRGRKRLPPLTLAGQPLDGGGGQR